MDHSYNTEKSSRAYKTFLASRDGKIFRSTLSRAFMKNISKIPTPLKLLDAGCGDGWLAGKLADELLTPKTKNEIHACDAGAPLIADAKQQYPKIQFSICDLNKPLPYEVEYFDIVTASMVIHDVEDELATLHNVSAILKPGGKLLASIVNPYYGYPVGEWKRGVIGRLLGRMPKLKLAKSYNELTQQNRPNFEWRPHLGSHFTPLSAHVSNAAKAGLALTGLTDLSSAADSNSYNLTYQLHRFPIILLLEFTKL
jgi:ubiquinone/menaquinone biosynthesis C-methylase UbiE